MTLLEEIAVQCDFRGTSKNKLEGTDAVTTELLKHARRKVEKLKRRSSYSNEKINKMVRVKLLEIKEETISQSNGK